MPMLGLRDPLVGITISDYFLASAFLVALLGGQLRRTTSNTIWWFGFFLVLAGLLSAAIASSEVGANLLVTLRLFLVLGPFAVLFKQFGRLPRFESAVLRCYVYGSAVSALAAIGQAAGIVPYQHIPFITNRYPGLAEHFNDFGGTLAIALVAALLGNAHLARSCRLLLPVVISIGLFLSGSGTSAIAALAGLAYGVYTTSTRSRRRFAYAPIALVVVSLLLAALTNRATLTDRLQVIKGSGGQGGTLASRIDTMSSAFDGIVASPIIGRGSSATEAAVLRNGTTTHNIFLLYWYQSGVMGAVGLCFLLRSVTRRRRAPRPPVIGATLVTALCFALTAPVQFQRYFWLPVLMALAVRRRAEPTGSALQPDVMAS